MSTKKTYVQVMLYDDTKDSETLEDATARISTELGTYGCINICVSASHDGKSWNINADFPKWLADYLCGQKFVLCATVERQTSKVPPPLYPALSLH